MSRLSPLFSRWENFREFRRLTGARWKKKKNKEGVFTEAGLLYFYPNPVRVARPQIPSRSAARWERGKKK